MSEHGRERGLIASFDIGSTAAKGALIDRQRGIVVERSAGYPTDYGPDGHIEQDPDHWWRAVIDLAGSFWREGWDPRRVEAIALTGQMQDLIPLDAALRPTGPAILYSDARAASQAAMLRATLAARGAGEDETRYLDATSPLAKLLWLRERQPQALARCAHTLFGAKDYILAQLAGVVAVDATTAATTGFYDQQGRRWHADWLPPLGLPPAWLPPLPPQTSAVGAVSPGAAALTGFVAGTPVYPGMGDAAAATLSAALVVPGDTYLYLGTTGWAASLKRAAGTELHGLRNLPAALGGLTIAIAPLLNAGSALDWAITLLGLGVTGDAPHAPAEAAVAAPVAATEQQAPRRAEPGSGEDRAVPRAETAAANAPGAQLTGLDSGQRAYFGGWEAESGPAVGVQKRCIAGAAGTQGGYGAFERLLLATPGRSEGILFLPYLNGERCPVQESRPQGTFLHLGSRSGPGQVAWAVLEGICFALRQILETLGGTPALGSLPILGGMANGTTFRQLLADVCGVAVRAPHLPGAAGALAAAIPVAIGQGWFATPEAAVARWFPEAGEAAVPSVPSPQWTAHYEASYDRYRRIYPAIAD